MGIASQSAVAPRLDALIEHGVEEGCLELSEVSELIAELGLEEANVDELFIRLEQRGVEISDDCGRDVSEQVTYGNDSLAAKTTDALDLFFAEMRRFSLLSASEEVSLAKQIENGDERRRSG